MHPGLEAVPLPSLCLPFLLMTGSLLKRFKHDGTRVNEMVGQICRRFAADPTQIHEPMGQGGTSPYDARNGFIPVTLRRADLYENSKMGRSLCHSVLSLM